MKINRCLIVDTETANLEDLDSVIEIGLILYSVTNQQSLVELSYLIPRATNEAEHINGIKAASLEEMNQVGRLDRNADGSMLGYIDDLETNMVSNADVIVAHNAEFDRPRFTNAGRDKKWVCTMADMQWPRATKPGNESLVSLALNHGIGVASAHRALTDCRLIAALFDRMDDLLAMFAVAMRPKALFEAIVSFERKDEAKAAGFQWTPAPVKSWTRVMALEDAAKLPFKVRQIGEEL